MNDKSVYLKQIPVPSQVYQQLQQLWNTVLLDYQRHTPEQAIQAAKELSLLAAAQWIETHKDDYAVGLKEVRWRLAGKFTGDVICHRFEGQIGMTALTNVPRSIIHHSPDGHEWGYEGSGPADLALDILNWFLPPNEEKRSECGASLLPHRQVEEH